MTGAWFNLPAETLRACPCQRITC